MLIRLNLNKDCMLIIWKLWLKKVIIQAAENANNKIRMLKSNFVNKFEYNYSYNYEVCYMETSEIYRI
jgi:hypothetical protein